MTIICKEGLGVTDYCGYQCDLNHPSCRKTEIKKNPQLTENMVGANGKRLQNNAHVSEDAPHNK